jgi:hypothetical protein
MAITQNSITNISHGYDSITQKMITHGSGSIIAPPLVPKFIEYPIQGKMLTTSLTLHASEHTQMSELEIKTRLTELLVREIWDNNCIEFTKQQDYVRNEVVVRARIFVTPKDDVQVIRKVLK